VRNIFISAALLILLSGACLKAQKADLTGYRIFINPGHGGYDSDDRHMLATDFWESEGNLVKGLYLRDILRNLKADVYMSRTTNNTGDDLPLSAISQMANELNIHFFLSIHSNGFDGKQNHPLMLFRGYDNQPVYPDSKTMALIIWQKVFEKGNCWTGSNVWVKGDWSFYPDWGTQGLGVLRGLTMPGVLSEGSFHDYIPEGWRLRNTDFLQHEAWAFLRSFIEFQNVTPLQHGVIAGVIRDSLISPAWYFKPGTRDEAMPLNGATVTLVPGNRKYNVDELNNGFFLFDSVPPGNYKLFVDGVQDYMRDSLSVTVDANKSVLADIYLKFDTTMIPVLTGLSPGLTDSIPFNQEFIFTFDLPMDRDSVQKALKFVPSADLVFSWDEKSRVLKVRPAVGFQSKTNYVINIGTTACSMWKVPIASAAEYSFVTRSRSALKLESSYPLTGRGGVTLYPQIRLWFDAPLNQLTSQTGTELLNDQGQPVTKVREEWHEKNGKGGYFFELSQPLAVNKQYRIRVSSSVSDITGLSTGHSVEIPFTTRTKSYESGTVIESYDNISDFWDPDASGSTMGTDNPLTTFIASPEIKRSGSNAGRLDYVFTGADGGVCRVFDTKKPSIGSSASNLFGIWVFGDMSMNLLEYWFYSSGSTNHIVYVDTLSWAGWDLKTIPISSIGGSGDRLYHSVVVRQTAAGSKSGTVWFDDAMVIVPTAVEDIAVDSGSLTVYPNPASSNVTISYDLDARSAVSVDLFTTDGRRAMNIYKGTVDQGPQMHHWSPPSVLTEGSYIIRLEKTSPAGRSSSAVMLLLIR
jgi:hypothetical protein